MAHGQIENIASNNLEFEHKNNVPATSNIPLKEGHYDEEFSGSRKKNNDVQTTPIVRSIECSSAHINGDSSTGERIVSGETGQQKDGQSWMVNQAETTMAQISERKHEIFRVEENMPTRFEPLQGRVGTGVVEGKIPVKISNEPTFDNMWQKKCHQLYTEKEAKRKPLKVDTPDSESLLPAQTDTEYDIGKMMHVESRFEWDEKNFTTQRSLWFEPERLESDQMMLDMVKAKLVKMLTYGKRRKLTVPDIDRVFDEHVQTLGNVFLRTPRLIPLMNMYGNKRWLRAFGRIHGRAFPWQVMLSQAIWVAIIFCVHPYGLGGIPSFAWRLDGWMWKVLGISVGFLLKQHAMCANKRWMEARMVWENIIDKTRGLIVILTCAGTSTTLMREAVTHCLGCPICIKNWLLGATDVAWKAELMMVLPVSSCERIMEIRPRSRAVFCLYSVQRVIEVMVENHIIPKALVRDINPRIIRLSSYLGECSKIRETRIPYQYIVHIRFVLVAYLMYLPFLLMGISEMTWLLLLWYVLLISYAFGGLESMATTILNPFGESESHLALDLYCYLIISDSRFILGKDLIRRMNFVSTFETVTLNGRLNTMRKIMFLDKAGNHRKEEVKNNEEKTKRISLQHVALQRSRLPTQPDDLKIGDVVIVGCSLDRQDLKGARGLVVSSTAEAGEKGFIVKVPPHGNIELMRTQIIFLQKGPHPQTPEGKSLIEEQRLYNESLPSAPVLFQHTATQV